MTDLDTARRAVAALSEFADAAKRCRELPYRDPRAQVAYEQMFDAAIDEHIPALVRSLAPSAWQPIETAPRDGEWIMLGGGKIVYGWYAEQPPLVVGQWTDEAGGGDEGRWQFAWYDGGYYGEYEAPTHWMPAPPCAAPAGGDA